MGGSRDSLRKRILQQKRALFNPLIFLYQKAEGKRGGDLLKVIQLICRRALTRFPWLLVTDEFSEK